MVYPGGGTALQQLSQKRVDCLDQVDPPFNSITYKRGSSVCVDLAWTPWTLAIDRYQQTLLETVD